MKILLFGKNGQVGWELQRALSSLGELIALERNKTNGLCGDLTKTESLRETIRLIAPDVIVNAAAYTAVDKAEAESELAFQINAVAVGVIAEEAAKLGCWLLHYSTDYVFNGTGSLSWSESDTVSPLNQYGASKLAGEQAVITSGCKYLIFRTSWVYGVRGNNFAKTMLRLAKERQVLNVIVDQVGAPTGADLIADVSCHALRQALSDNSVSGLYHLTAAGETTWYDYARLVIEFGVQSGEDLAVKKIEPINSDAYLAPAKRPLNSRLNTRKLSDTFSIYLPDWRAGVTRMLKEAFEK